MRDRFRNFHMKRMEIFKELIRRQWKNPLTKEDLDCIAQEIVQKYGYQPDEISFVKDHIRVALGQNPNRSANFTNEAEFLQNHPRVERPILTKIEGACKECGERFEDCACYDTCKYEAQMYRRSSGPVIIEDKCL